MREALLELAEEPGLWLPLAPPSEVIEADGYAVVTSPRTASVERVRLARARVDAAVEEVRALARGRGWEFVTWWLGELTTPAGLAERLLELGLRPDADSAELTSFTIARPPARAPSVEVRPVETLDDYLRALELDWDAWEVPEERRAEYRPLQRAAWPQLEASGRAAHFVAYLDGEPAGFARVVFAPAAGILMGGSTLPAARGRGVYTSLVHARWQATAERGVPRLAVSAGAMSAPILERLGFEPIGKVLLLRDSLA
jgi:GNAT superfamily N-acetyltransferase